MTNYFRLSFTLNDDKNHVEYVQYRADIIDVKRQGFENNKVVLKRAKEGAEGEMDLSRGATPLSRRILDTLRRRNELFFASDGTETVIAPHRLFEGKEKTFDVLVRKECDEDDPDADRTPKKWFQVKLMEVAIVNMTSPNAELERVRQLIDIVQKSALLENMIAYGRSPRSFYFQEKEQQRIMQNQDNRSGLKRIYENVSCCNYICLSLFIRSSKNVDMV